MEISNKLKCFFAFSSDIENNQIYIDLLIATLESAVQNTTLDLHCIYIGSENDNIYKILKKYNVTIYITDLQFFSKLKNVYTEEYIHKNALGHISDLSMKARFSRFLIPLFTQDEYVLYCDTDLIFLKDIRLEDFPPPLPKTIAVCPECENIQFYDYFNAGVMLINIKSFAEKYKELIKMLDQGQHASIECYDQGYLNDLYKNNFEKLPLEYNWKSYWGYNDNIKILHFHGLKPNMQIKQDLPFLRPFIYDNDVYTGFYKNYELFCKYSGADKEECFSKLKETLSYNLKDNYIYKKIKKARKHINALAISQFILFIIVIYLLFKQYI